MHASCAPQALGMARPLLLRRAHRLIGLPRRASPSPGWRRQRRQVLGLSEGSHGGRQPGPAQVRTCCAHLISREGTCQPLPPTPPRCPAPPPSRACCRALSGPTLYTDIDVGVGTDALLSGGPPNSGPNAVAGTTWWNIMRWVSGRCRRASSISFFQRSFHSLSLAELQLPQPAAR